MSKPKSDYTIQTVCNALRLLDVFQDEAELGVSELSRRLELHKNNVFRLLATLELGGYVEQSPADRSVSSGCSMSRARSRLRAQSHAERTMPPRVAGPRGSVWGKPPTSAFCIGRRAWRTSRADAVAFPASSASCTSRASSPTVCWSPASRVGQASAGPLLGARQGADGLRGCRAHARSVRSQSSCRAAGPRSRTRSRRSRSATSSSTSCASVAGQGFAVDLG